MRERHDFNKKIITIVFLIIAPFVLFACGKNLDNELVKGAKEGKSQVVELLLAKGANVNAKDSEYGSTALMWAAHNGHAETLKILIRNGATIDGKGKKGETALWFAAQKGQIETMKILRANGADINVVGRNGDTALVVAKKNGYEAIADYLIKSGASE